MGFSQRKYGSRVAPGFWPESWSRAMRIKYTNAASRSCKKKMDFTITLEEAEKIFRAPCVYCNDFSGCSVMDRKDSGKGYTKENVQPACNLCNMMKMNLPERVFLEHVKKIKIVAPEAELMS